MRIGAVEHALTVEGPGLRTAIWVQGCSIGCRGCCNPEFTSPLGGWDEDPLDLAAKVIAAGGDGITILGGEPLEQAADAARFITTVRSGSSMGIILFTGMKFDHAMSDPDRRLAILGSDLVIAGPFLRSLAPDPRRWIGSSNQTVHFITDRYARFKTAWPGEDMAVEIVADADGIRISGNPAAIASLCLAGRALD